MSTHHDVIVIGGGQAGLALGHQLERQGRDFTILDAADAPAAAWRERWDSLRLFTPARYDSLPGKPFPGDPDHYPTRDEVVAYLTDYARDLPVELRSRVNRLRRADDGYLLELDDRTYTATNVVVATGPFQTPRTPSLAAGLAPEVHQLHSADYRNPAQIPAGRVLIVGGGNTGYQIATELAATHEVHLALGTPQKPLPQRLLGRDIFRYLDAIGALTKPVDTPIGRRMRTGDTLIGSSPRRARRQGVTLRPRAAAANGTAVSFADGSDVTVTSVIWATGFALEHSWIEIPVFADDGAPHHTRGATTSPGLYFLGLPWMHTRGSALLGWVKHDAAHIAAHIHARAVRERTSVLA
jgi:putative flavoprotein involved in K+ transport